MTPRVALRLGDYRHVLQGVECDAVITDPPYTSRVMFGYRSATMIKAGVKEVIRKPTIPYAAITESDAVEFARWSTATARNWIVAFNDHVGWRWLAEAIEAQGWYVFAPVVWLARNSTPRFCGDGPNDACEYIVVARPRKVVKCGSLPGYYDCNRMSSLAHESVGLVGQKPQKLMRAIIEHYTSAGNVVCDPFAGSASTLVAARDLGRHAIGAERDPATFALARERLSRPPAAEEKPSGRGTDRDQKLAVPAVGKRARAEDRRAGEARAGRAEGEGGEERDRRVDERRLEADA